MLQGHSRLVGFSFLYINSVCSLNPASVKPEESVHPSPAVAIPAIIPPVWLLAESPSKANPEERDRVLSMLPFPRVRHDSAARSSSAYSNLKPRQIRHSVPILSSPPSDFVNDPTPRSETP